MNDQGKNKVPVKKQVGLSMNEFVNLMNNTGSTSVNLLQSEYKKELKEVTKLVEHKLEEFK